MDKLFLTVWRPRTTLVLIIGAALVLVGLFISVTVMAFQPTTEVRLGSGVYSLKLVNTDADRKMGLSNVPSIGANGGLLMAYDSSDFHGIWMKDMNFPLDIIWLDSSKKVVYIVKNASPEDPAKTVYTPKTPARYVLELPAGSVKNSGIKTGDTAKFNIDV